MDKALRYGQYREDEFLDMVSKNRARFSDMVSTDKARFLDMAYII